MGKIKGWKEIKSPVILFGQRFERLWESDERYLGIRKVFGYEVVQLKKGLVVPIFGKLPFFHITKQEAIDYAIAYMKRHPNG